MAEPLGHADLSIEVHILRPGTSTGDYIIAKITGFPVYDDNDPTAEDILADETNIDDVLTERARNGQITGIPASGAVEARWLDVISNPADQDPPAITLRFADL